MTFGSEWSASVMVAGAGILLVGVAIATVMLSKPIQDTYQVASESTRLVQLTPPSDIIPVCGNKELREQIRALMLAGLDDALRDRIHNLFDVWLKDETGQPGRAARGTHQSISAYVRARDSLEKWDLPECRSH
jgi:hypothetical protein